MKHFVLDSFALLVFFEQQKDWKKVEGFLLFSALQHPRNFFEQFGTVRFVNHPF